MRKQRKRGRKRVIEFPRVCHTLRCPICARKPVCTCVLISTAARGKLKETLTRGLAKPPNPAPRPNQINLGVLGAAWLAQTSSSALSSKRKHGAAPKSKGQERVHRTHFAQHILHVSTKDFFSPRPPKLTRELLSARPVACCSSRKKPPRNGPFVLEGG